MSPIILASASPRRREIFGKYIEGFDGDFENVVGLSGKRVEEILQGI